MGVNHTEIQRLLSLGNQYLNNDGRGDNLDLIKHQMMENVPKNSVPRNLMTIILEKSVMHVKDAQVVESEEVKHHPIMEDPWVVSVFENGGLEIPIVLGGVVDALRQILDNGEQYLSINVLYEITKIAMDSKSERGVKSYPGLLWAHGFVTACEQVLTGKYND